MINIHNALAERESGARMILQVHDELLFEVPPAELDDVKILVRSEMEGALKLDVPIAVEMGVGSVEMGVGSNWYETKAGT
jgi:DNA polymerase-1